MRERDGLQVSQRLPKKGPRSKAFDLRALASDRLNRQELPLKGRKPRTVHIMLEVYVSLLVALGAVLVTIVGVARGVVQSQAFRVQISARVTPNLCPSFLT